jgi:hypothetical protein
VYHCGTHHTGWLTGWPAGADQDSGGRWRRPGTDGPDDAGQPGYHYATPAAAGALPPPAGQPPAAGTVCFSRNGGYNNTACYNSTPVRSVGCGTFALWELPPAPLCNYAYCLAT